MANEKVSIAVLLVGSLDWDESPARARWRESRLDMSHRTLVSAPIRYGRKSATRGGTYTMVFSHELNAEGQSGVGIAVVCKHPVFTIDHLLTEAEYLWAAETNSDKPAHSISATWGCVGVLPHPRKRTLAPLLTAWAQHVSSEKCYGRIAHAKGESEIVNPTGTMSIAWPRTKDGKNFDSDIILMTATAKSAVNMQGNIVG